jgi:hypothetical protein
LILFIISLLSCLQLYDKGFWGEFQYHMLQRGGVGYGVNKSWGRKKQGYRDRVWGLGWRKARV